MRTTPFSFDSLLSAFLVCAILLVSCAAAADTWSDDFDDGDFTADPLWYDYANGAEWQKATIVVTSEEHYVRFKRDAHVEYGGYSYLRTHLNLPLTAESAISFDVNPVYSNVPGGAGPLDQDYPIEVDLRLIDADGNHLQLHFCYNYRGGAGYSSSSYMRVVFPYCEQNAWLRDQTFRIVDYFPRAVFMRDIYLRADGWDYEGHIDNIVLSDVVVHKSDDPFFVPGLDTLYVELEAPEDEVLYSPCAPGTIRWHSNLAPWQDSPSVFHFHWRECEGVWNPIGESSDDGVHIWPSPPCPEGCYELRIAHERAPELSDIAAFSVDESLLPPFGPPDVCVFVDFSGDAQHVFDAENRVDPPPYTLVTAYIAASRMDGEPEGLKSISFRLNDMVAGSPGVIGAQTLRSMLPGNLTLGDPFGSIGVTLESLVCVQIPYEGVEYLAEVELFYLGGACDLTILDHAQYPRWYVDCQSPGQLVPFCIWTHGGIGKVPVAGPSGCIPNTAAKAATWGAIKAMYRQ